MCIWNNAYKTGDNFRNLLFYHQNAKVNLFPWLFFLEIFCIISSVLFYFVLSSPPWYIKVQIMTQIFPKWKNQLVFECLLNIKHSYKHKVIKTMVFTSVMKQEMNIKCWFFLIIQAIPMCLGINREGGCLLDVSFFAQNQKDILFKFIFSSTIKILTPIWGKNRRVVTRKYIINYQTNYTTMMATKACQCI